ncbi:hypothetical protein AN958_01801 [Leucoagaricus sp. SymC.cos]|nr:hypothetical protein AN958_01801 [Leucoagaricus sp. SymC.cos]
MNFTIFGHEFPECVKPARYRTMQGIIWSCLATIFACTWVSMHPNVPDPRFSAWQRLCERFKLLFYALTGPELVAVWAYRQKMMATKYAKYYNDHFKLNPPSRPKCKRFSIEWSRSKWQGSKEWFPSKWQGIKEWFRPSEKRKAREYDRAWTTTHGFLFEMQGLECFQDGRPLAIQPYYPDENPSFSLPELVGRTAVVCHPRQLLHQFDISEEEIKDKSKGDGFTKFVAICQTLWFMIQCIARWVTHLHVTDLEVVTLAFTFANIMIYCLWWNKPQNMTMAIRVDRPDSRDQENKIGSGPNSVAQQTVDRTWFFRIAHFLSFLASFVMIIGMDSGSYISPEARIRFYTSDKKGNQSRRVAFMTSVVGMVFGGVHLIPLWLSSFPSFRKKRLWIMSTIIIIYVPLGFANVSWVVRRLLRQLRYPPSTVPHRTSFLLTTMTVVMWFYYISCRSILIYLAFDNLRFLPPDAFLNVEWSTYFPHI